MTSSKTAAADNAPIEFLRLDVDGAWFFRNAVIANH
jgi:hypothetical protein